MTKRWMGLLALVALLGPLAGWAQGCEFRNRLTFPGGQTGCITDYRLAGVNPRGYGRSVDQLMPATGNYGIAASASPGGACPLVAGMAIESAGVMGGAQDSAMILRRGGAALAACEGGMSSANASRACLCQLVVIDGRATLPKDEFDRRYLRGELLARADAQPAAPTPAPAAAQPALPLAAVLPPLPAAPAVVQLAAPASSVRRHALVIGNNDYRHVAGLNNARADARAMADALSGAGFGVTLRMDMDERGFKQVLRDFRLQVEPGDEVVLFFAGHGVQLGGANFLLPVDIRGDSEEQVRDDAMPLQRVLDDLAERRAGFMLAILDACRDNPFRTSNSRALGIRGLAPTTAATGQMIIYSAGTGQQALDRLGPDDRDPNGLFTRVFLREMEQPDLTVDRMLRNVRNEVVRLARSVGHQQTPALYDQAVGDFYLKRSR